jgi:DNA-binding response OmpR family regulator
MKVMIADDDHVRVRMVPNYLEQRGFQATPSPR